MNRCFFVDMNSFFASVEQQERPELRGRPMIVAPMLVDSTCAIAASYEAKALGIKTGTGVSAAKRVCPDIAIVEARPELYLQYHRSIMEALNLHFVNPRPLSVDEMVCKISPLYTGTEEEVELAKQVKCDIRRQIGKWMRCSIGIAPNVFLAKLATDRQKPDGLTIYRSADLPEALFDLNLLDLPGIANRMLARLETHGIKTVRQLYEADSMTLRRAWGGVVGARWHWMLRGSQEADYGAYIGQPRKSAGHSHVLPPEFRTRDGVIQIVLRLFSKALKGLRSYEMGASTVEICIDYQNRNEFSSSSWRKRSSKHIHSNLEFQWIRTVRPMLDSIPETKQGVYPIRAGITFSDLLAEKDQTLSLFPEEEEKQARLVKIMDGLNAKGHDVEFAAHFWHRSQAPNRISFGPPR